MWFNVKEIQRISREREVGFEWAEGSGSKAATWRSFKPYLCTATWPGDNGIVCLCLFIGIIGVGWGDLLKLARKTAGQT